MTHYRMLDRFPSVLITNNRNELKVYQGNIVYLNNGDNFELRFFNPLQEKLGVEIIFNGIKKGDGYLVLNPGQDIILDRFLDEQRKMIFETYTVNGSDAEAVKAIEKNGFISFNFYKEYYSRHNNDTININYNFPPKIKKSFKNTKGVQGTTGPQGVIGTRGITGTATAGVYFNNTINDTSNVYDSFDNFIYTSSLSFSPTKTFNPLETGRVEKGDYSNQNLRQINTQFASTPFYSMDYQILPYSAMNRNINEVREYCTGCGYRLRKQSWQFCPKCGQKLN